MTANKNVLPIQNTLPSVELLSDVLNVPLGSSSTWLNKDLEFIAIWNP